MRRSAYFSIIASVGSLVAVFTLIFLVPQVDPLRSGISFYGGTQFGPLVAFAFTLAGISALFLASALWSSSRSIGGRIGRIMLGVWGAIFFSEAEFFLNTPNATPAHLETHNLGVVMLNVLIMAPAALLIEFSPSSLEPRPGRSLTYWLAWLILASLSLLCITNFPSPSFGIGGLVQRLYWLILTLWFVLKARHVLQHPMA